MKRLLNCTATDFSQMKGKELLASIRASEGRVIVSEVIGTKEPLVADVTNAEVAAAFGADLLLFNLFDVNNPNVRGLDAKNHLAIIHQVKAYTGRPLGINLEPVDDGAQTIEKIHHVPNGRIASFSSLEKAKSLGFDFVCLTGNPKTGVTNKEIVSAIERANQVFHDDGIIIAGKMHSAGVAAEYATEIIDEATINRFMHAGADIILLPAPGTIPGFTLEKVHGLIQVIHKQGGLALLTVGTSQESADPDTIRQIALQSKMAGADLYHLGDGSFSGIAPPENILTYSIAIRGKRHTYYRMAASIRR